MKLFCAFLAVLTCGLLVTSNANAQSTGTVSGRVLDQTEASIAGVSVEIVSASRANTAMTVTGLDGSYVLQGVPAGAAEITFKLINFATVRRQIVVPAGETVNADAVLHVSYTADITITAPLTFRNLAEVEAPAENLVGIASSGSEGAITSAQLQARPIMRAGEVLETVPGMIVSQHSGEGKANQYYLRGFNLDHGLDFSTTLAGIPVNFPTQAHAHGYSDTNFLIPELVSGVQYRKGPYYAEEGDFSSAGAANINYVNQLERPLFDVSGGALGWGRVLGAFSPRVGSGHLLTAIELNHNDGPWVRPDDIRKINGIVRYSRGGAQNGFSLSALGYNAGWNSTDQVPLRAIENGVIDRYGHIDPTDKGRSFRYMGVADFQRSQTNRSTRVIGYVQRYGMNLFQNFTYFLDDPVNGDQFEQEDRRWVGGGQITHRRLGRIGRFNTETAFGGEFRHDAIGTLGLFKAVQGRRAGTKRLDKVGQTSGGAFAQTEIEWSRFVRTTLGLRGDAYHYNVKSDNPLNSGIENTGILSPKATLVLGPWADTEFYINAGLGFHSNNALGATLTVDPTTGDPAPKTTPIVRARGAEAGVRTVRLRKLQSTASLWMLDYDSELIFVGDTGSTESGRPSHRYGIEITNYAYPRPWLAMDFDLSLSRARFRDEDAAGTYIPGALDRVISTGLAITPERGAFGSVRLRHFGPRPLVEDNSVKSRSTSIVNGEIGWKFSNQLRVVLEGFNLFDSKVADIDYFYSSRLPGEPAGGVEDIHTHPALPRSARVSLRMSF